MALDMADYAGFEERRRDSRSRGKLRGIGISNTIERAAAAGFEGGEIRFDRSGTATVLSGATNHGQGHETVFKQLVCDRLGLAFDDVHYGQGDTDIVPFGQGTGGSRSATIGGSALLMASDKIIEKATKIAAHLMEASVEDIEFDDGNFKVAGTDKSTNIAAVAFTAYVPHSYPEGVEPGLEETAFYDPGNFTYPAGVHIAEVEIDPETGITSVLDWVAVDDFGKVVNPMIVEGQVHGGVAQGIGQALLESTVYDPDSGQLITGSYMDYCMPRADNLPNFRVDTTETACTHNPLGVKGCGEAGAIAAPAALMNAITNAIGREIDMPATPEKVWAAINQPRLAAE